MSVWGRVCVCVCECVSVFVRGATMSFGPCQWLWGSQRMETEQQTPCENNLCFSLVHSVTRTRAHTRTHTNTPLGLIQIGKMGNIREAQLVTGPMCLVSQVSQAQRDRMWCQRDKRGQIEGHCKHIRPCWDTAGGRNSWQDEKETWAFKWHSQIPRWGLPWMFALSP